jgi:hypothetical protein
MADPENKNEKGKKNDTDKNKKNLLILLAALESALGNFFYLVQLETQAAKNSLKILACSFLSIVLLLTTAWFSLMAAFAFYLASMGLTWPLSFLSVLTLNVVFIGVIQLLLKKHARRLTFPVTRRQINNVKKAVFKP